MTQLNSRQPERARPYPLQGLIRGLWITILFCLLLPVLSAAAGVDSRGPAMMATVVGGILLLLLPLFYMLQRKYRREVDELLSGGHLAHWRLERPEWEQFLYADWSATKSQLMRFALYIAAAGIGGGILIGLAGEDLRLALTIGSGLSMLFTAIPLLLLWSARVGMRRRLAGKPEVWVGLKGVYLCDQYIRWGSPGPRSVKLGPERPAILRVELYGKSSFDGPPVIRIPVPAGREDEAAELRTRLRQAYTAK